MEKNKDIILRKIAEYLFNEWKEEKLKEGYHLPELCPSYEKSEEERVEDHIIHCNKCLINLCSFNNLDDHIRKDYLSKAEKLYNDFSKIGLNIVMD